MLKGLAITPPTIGRISIGKVIEKNGKRIPEKDDEFTVTSLVQSKGEWVLHPLDAQLRKDQQKRNAKALPQSSDQDTETNGASKEVSTKLRSIPVRLLFDAPDLNLRTNYSMFDRQSGRPLCVGNGETCKRSLSAGVQTLPCPSPEGCELARGGNCKPFGRLHVRIGDGDELGSFILRTSGYNTIRTLSSRLEYFHAASGGKLATLPLELRLRGKSTTKSHRTPIYFVDLTVPEGITMAQAIAKAREEGEVLSAAGFNQAALDDAARKGFAAGAFEESEEDGSAVVKEFYPDDAQGHYGAGTDGLEGVMGLVDRLNHKAQLIKHNDPSHPSNGKVAGMPSA